MKIKYIIFYLVAAIISSAFAFPENKFFIRQADSVMQKRDTLPETQRLERCENNKKRIAELEAQLRVTDAELSQAMEKKEIDDGSTGGLKMRRPK